MTSQDFRIFHNAVWASHGDGYMMMFSGEIPCFSNFFLYTLVPLLSINKKKSYVFASMLESSACTLSVSSQSSTSPGVRYIFLHDAFCDCINVHVASTHAMFPLNESSIIVTPVCVFTIGSSLCFTYGSVASCAKITSSLIHKFFAIR